MAGTVWGLLWPFFLKVLGLLAILAAFVVGFTYIMNVRDGMAGRR